MKTTKLFSMLMAFAILAFATSCGDDDPPVITVEEGLPVADGFYITQEGVDPVAINKLNEGIVEDDGFSSKSREGFMQSYLYLTSGSYHVVEVVDKAIANTYGGTLTTVSDEDVRNKECDTDNSNYGLANADVDGAAFSVSTDGLYVVAYDVDLKHIIFDKIESAGIIGGATPGGWGADTEMNTSASITSDGATWTLEGVTIDVGEMKFRFNCRWSIDKRVDNTLSVDDGLWNSSNGYVMFTNYGGTIESLVAGGSNMQNEEYAVYTVTMSWDPTSGFSATKTKTGEAEPKPEYPAELHMVGATIGGWDWATNGIQMIPVHSNPHLFWKIVWMDAAAADPGIKFAPQADWIGDFGIDGTATDGVFAKGVDNVPAPASSGYYMVVVNLETGAETIEVNEPLVYGIGSTFSDDTWTAESATNLFTIDNVNEVITSSAFAADGELRIHVAASTMKAIGSDPAVEWWHAEFVPINNVIEYRGTGGDQDRTDVTTGQTVSLNFKTGTATIQ